MWFALLHGYHFGKEECLQFKNNDRKRFSWYAVDGRNFVSDSLTLHEFATCQSKYLAEVSLQPGEYMFKDSRCNFTRIIDFAEG